MKHKQDGFTIIELLVTLFVAAIFLIAGYQIYTTVIRTDGQTKAQVTAEGLATDYGARYVASAPYPCVASQPDGPYRLRCGASETFISAKPPRRGFRIPTTGWPASPVVAPALTIRLDGATGYDQGRGPGDR